MAITDSVRHVEHVQQIADGPLIQNVASQTFILDSRVGNYRALKVPILLVEVRLTPGSKLIICSVQSVVYDTRAFDHDHWEASGDAREVLQIGRVLKLRIKEAYRID